MIRHAQSRANVILKDLGENPLIGQIQDSMYVKDIIDCDLSQKGIEECQIAAHHAKQINFHTVWISPLRRTLHTAYHIFKNHPNFAKIRFKVEPLLREKLRIAGDMPSKDVLEMIEKEFQPKFKGRLEIDLME